MSERTKIKETETAGEYGEQVIVHGKTSGGVYKPIYIGDDGKVKIDPVPPDVNAIADQVWDEALSGHVVAGSAGKKLGDIPTTVMRGTNNAALASVCTEARLAHLTQDIPNMVGTNNAALASVCTEARLAHLVRDIPVMVGTNNAALASVCTEARLAHLTQDIPNMVGTNNAALASVCTEARLAELAAANLPADVAAIQTLLNEVFHKSTVSDFQANPATGTASNPSNINDNDVGTSTDFDAVDEYCIIMFTRRMLIKQFRHYGVITHNGDGAFTVQYYDCCLRDWVTWIEGVATHDAFEWTTWEEVFGIETTGIKIIATALDSGLFDTNYEREWEVKY